MTYLSWARCLLMAFCFQGLAQADAPSQAELQYLSSVLPLIQARAWSDAEGKLLEGLKQFSRSAVLSNALGMVYEQENKNDDAIQAFEHATEWLPNFTAAQLHLASLLVETGACGRAEPLFLDVAKGTADPGALSATGIGLAQCKNYSSAVEVLKKAHALNLQSAATTFNLALAQFEHGEDQFALEALDTLPPGAEQQRPEALFLRGKLVPQRQCQPHAERGRKRITALTLLLNSSAKSILLRRPICFKIRLRPCLPQSPCCLPWVWHSSGWAAIVTPSLPTRKRSIWIQSPRPRARASAFCFT